MKDKIEMGFAVTGVISAAVMIVCLFILIWNPNGLTWKIFLTSFFVFLLMILLTRYGFADIFED